MDKILEILANETDGTCYTSFRYCVDDEIRLPTLSYEETEKFTIKGDRYGETNQDNKSIIDLSSYAKRIQK